MAKDLRGLHIDTDFFQQGESLPSSLNQRHQRQGVGSDPHDSESLGFQNSFQYKGVVLIQNTIKTLLLKQLFSSWATLRISTGMGKSLNSSTHQSPSHVNDYQNPHFHQQHKPQLQSEIKDGQDLHRGFEKMSIKKQSHKNDHTINAKRQQTHLYPQQENINNKKRNQSINPHFKTQTRSDQESVHNSLRIYSYTPENIEKRLNLHAHQMRQINRALSLQYVNSRSRQFSIEGSPRERRQGHNRSQLQFINKRYRRSGNTILLTSKEHSSINESRSLIIKGIIQKLKNQRINHQRELRNSSLSLQVGKKIQNSDARDSIRQSAKHRQNYREGTQFEQRFDNRLNRLQKMLMNIKKQHKKIQGSKAVQKTILKISKQQNQDESLQSDRYKNANQTRKQKTKQMSPGSEYRDDNQESKYKRKIAKQFSQQNEYYKKALQNLKRELQEVKVANSNIWSYAKSIQIQSKSNRPHIGQKKSATVVESQNWNQQTANQKKYGQIWQDQAMRVSGKSQFAYRNQMWLPSVVIERTPILPIRSNSRSNIRPISQPLIYEEKNVHFKESAGLGHQIPIQRQSEATFTILYQPLKVKSTTVFKDQNQTTQAVFKEENTDEARRPMKSSSNAHQQYRIQNHPKMGRGHLTTVPFPGKQKYDGEQREGRYNNNLFVDPYSSRQQFQKNLQIAIKYRQAEQNRHLQNMSMSQNRSQNNFTDPNHISSTGEDNQTQKQPPVINRSLLTNGNSLGSFHKRHY